MHWDDAWVEAEPRYLHRALQNLVSNAMRHAQGPCADQLSSGPGVRCRIDVEDDGPGVPETAWGSASSRRSCVWTTAALAVQSKGYGPGLSIVHGTRKWKINLLEA